jgi:hypothetical protein
MGVRHSSGISGIVLRSKPTRGWLRGAGRILALGAALLLIVWGRAFYESREAHHEGEKHFQENRYIQAITFFDRSIHWYTPFSPYVEKSAARLWEISRIAERNGDFVLSRIAVTALRSGFRAAGGLFSPGEEWIGNCEERIEGLLRLEAAQKGIDPDRFQMEKGVPPPPSLFWTLILEIGLLGWVGSVICLVLCGARKGENRENRTLAAFVRWGSLLVVFYAMWIIGMMKA